MSKMTAISTPLQSLVIARGRAFPILTILAALITCLLLLPGGPVQAHPHEPQQTHEGVAEGAEHIHYAEKGTGDVRDFDSKDPEGSRIEWNVRGVDAADFEMSSTGVLTFKSPPDFENPADRGLDLNADDNFTGDGEFAPDDNLYQITVSATEISAALPAKRTDMALTVIVGNADDDGELTLQWLQPEVGVGIDATLTDTDGTTSSPTWTWYTSKAADPEVGNLFHWNIISGQTDDSYEPVAADEGDYLWVHVEYTDPQSTDDTKTADAKSMHPVRAAVSAGGNASPDFGVPTDTRTVPESTAVGDPVGGPVSATDTDNDTLTYELDDDVDSTNPLADASDLQFFDVDRESGQILVAQDLDYDAVGDGRADDAVAGTYTVVVRATDPSGLADNITVTITAENVNEAPIVTGRAELTVAEEDDDGYTAHQDAPAITAPPDPTNQANEYVYVDPDHLDSIARWDLEGDDAGAFDHSGRFEPRYLQFKEPPDFENPTDRNMDNVYEVTLVATDTDPLRTGAGVGKVNVWLIVTNAEEEGEVVFTEGETAYLNEMLVAEVQDPDDHGGDLGEPHEGVHIVNWQWSRSLTDATDETFTDIVGATTNRYTPKESDRGYYLRATARYTDPHSAEDDPTTEADERVAVSDPPEATDSLRIEMTTTETVVRLAPGPGSVPTFGETGAVTRYVAENTGPGGNVGAPVAATGPGDLVYSLEGSDAQYFNIDDMGQITVGGDNPDTGDTEPGTDPELDFDDPAKKQRFSITVKVEVMDGGANQNAQIDVNIMVTDVDEELAFTEGEAAVEYPEIDEDGAPNTADVETYVVEDPEGDTISWDLRGVDAALFTIDGGVLKFRAAPDYENPKDGTRAAIDMNGDGDADDPGEGMFTTEGTYTVFVRAIASRDSGDTGPAETVDMLVNVTVMNVDEDGEVDISWLQPEAGTEITASLTDPDGPSGATLPVTNTAITGATWVWTVSEVAANVLDIDNDDHWGAGAGTATDDRYEPGDSDEGKYLRVTATYTDGTQEATMARMKSAYPVQAEGGGALNGSPDFDGETVERTVAETADVGDDVGLPVTASLRPGDASKDRLTYSLRAVTAADLTNITGVDLPSGTDTEPADDLGAFDIDKATGQITVAQKLDFESRGDPDDGKYVVVVEVRDPSANTTPTPTIGYDFIVAVITAEDENEDPVLEGRPELTINEIDGGDDDAANPDFIGNPAPLLGQDPAVPTVNVYNVTDEDARAGTQRWDLEGEDKDQLQLIGSVGRTLVFRNQPDYEAPADADGDNVYKVTVVTYDGRGGIAEFDVCIAVNNIEEAGKITLLDEDGNELVQPHARGPITAELTDPDGGVTNLTWQWAKADVDPVPQGQTPDDITVATNNKYTPTNDDTGSFLHVTATYADVLSELDADGNPTANRTATEKTAHSVLEAEDQGRPPTFPQEAAGVEVAENSPSGTYVGEAIVAAEDPDGMDVTYTLAEVEDNEDAKFFALATMAVDDGQGNTTQVNTRQIVVKDPLLRAGTGPDSDPQMGARYDPADLNHEDGDPQTYTVELKASDGSADTEDATITITITVTDRNEAPSTPAASTDAPAPANNAPEFPATETGEREVAENTAAGENIADPVAATDADNDTLTYTLGGADMASFDIDGATGQLMTKDPLDFETKASYTVEVTASDGTDEAMIEVTITVTDVTTGNVDGDIYDANEDGVIEGSEVIQAVKDYFADNISGPEVIAVVKLYFAGRSS